MINDSKHTISIKKLLQLCRIIFSDQTTEVETMFIKEYEFHLFTTSYIVIL